MTEVRANLRAKKTNSSTCDPSIDPFAGPPPPDSRAHPPLEALPLVEALVVRRVLQTPVPLLLLRGRRQSGGRVGLG